MADFRSLENGLIQALALEGRPIAVIFGDEPPPNTEKFVGSEPSGCSFWRLAAEGKVFYTVPEDHYNCPIGSHTHGISLPPPRSGELPQLLDIMTGIGYLKMEEVPGIPTLQSPPKTIAYAPLGESPADPDVVLVVAVPGKIMLIEEAALRLGVLAKLPLLARPACAAIPAALQKGVVASAGCIGNRIYTQIGDHELYAAIPGRWLLAICESLRTIVDANNTLERYHELRKRELATQ
ncbi:MAG TPA: DUF169 domain-containing protein [Bryobacteraceae bacterium]|nr:DUF169 domain-containing protein [Bryobacteraceae bacterium]